MEFLGHIGNSILTFSGTTKLFSTTMHHFTFLPKTHKSSHFFTSSSTLVIFLLFFFFFPHPHSLTWGPSARPVCVSMSPGLPVPPSPPTFALHGCIGCPFIFKALSAFLTPPQGRVSPQSVPKPPCLWLDSSHPTDVCL